MGGYYWRKSSEISAIYGKSHVNALCSTFHVDVIEAAINPLIGYLGYDNYGAYIVVNRSLPRYIKHYIVAHELGHHLMHPHEVGFYWIIRNTYFLLEHLESDADGFAVALLGMSDCLFDQVQAYLRSVG